MRDYKTLLKAGKAAQVEKLDENPDKPGFDNIDLDWAYKRLKDETHELKVELYGVKIRDHESIRKEAADIANFATMIIYKCDQLLND